MFHDTLAMPTAADVPLILTLILLEGVLSFDNAAVLAALTNRLPREQRRKALLYGIVGAYVFRVLAILFVAVLLRSFWLQMAGAAYLVYLAVRHFAAGEHKGGAIRKPVMIPGISAFWSTVVFVELTDVAFALDQIVVAVALTDKVAVIILAALIGILFLRISAYYIGRIMEWFPALESLAYIAVAFVGMKMVWEHFFFHIPEYVSISVTLGLIVAPPLLRYILERSQGRKPLQEPAAEEPEVFEPKK